MQRFSQQPADDRPERVVPFPTRGIGEPDPPPSPSTPRRGSRPRRARRRRQDVPWLQRNALSVAAVSVLVALLGLGFGLVQLLTHPEPNQAMLAVGAVDQAALSASYTAAPAPASGAQPAESAPAAPAESGPRTIQATAGPLQANYTVQAGDTLAAIAVRFDTTVERIQRFNSNSLSDPRALRIGTKLVIPPPL